WLWPLGNQRLRGRWDRYRTCALQLWAAVGSCGQLWSLLAYVRLRSATFGYVRLRSATFRSDTNRLNIAHFAGAKGQDVCHRLPPFAGVRDKVVSDAGRSPTKVAPCAL